MIIDTINRNKLDSGDNGLASQIHHTDYQLSNDPETSLDLFCVLEKP